MESESFKAYRSLVSDLTNGMERVKQARAFNPSDKFLSRMEASYKEALMILNGSAPEEECHSVRSSASDPPDSSDYLCNVTQSNVSSGNPKKRKVSELVSAAVTSSGDPLKRELSQRVTEISPYPLEMHNDGHSWRKYGHKTVANSEYPRNFFKCTNRGCAARRKVDTSEDGTHVVAYLGNNQCPVTLRNVLSSDLPERKYVS